MPFPVLGALAIGAGANLIGNAIGNMQSIKGSKDLMALQQRYNEDNMQKQFEYQQKAQRLAYANMMSGQLAGGLNPAFDGSSPVTAASPTGGSPSASFSSKEVNLLQGLQFASLAADIKNKELLNTHQDLSNKLLKIEYDNAVSENDEYNHSVEPIPNIDASPNSPSLEPVILAHGGKGIITARNQLDELSTLSKERQARREQANANKAQAAFDEAFAKARNNPEFISVLKSLNTEQLNKLRQEVAKFREDVKLTGLKSAYQQLLNNEYEHTTISNVLGNLTNSDLSLWDKILSVVSFIGRQFVK